MKKIPIIYGSWSVVKFTATDQLSNIENTDSSYSFYVGDYRYNYRLVEYEMDKELD